MNFQANSLVLRGSAGNQGLVRSYYNAVEVPIDPYGSFYLLRECLCLYISIPPTVSILKVDGWYRTLVEVCSRHPEDFQWSKKPTGAR